MKRIIVKISIVLLLMLTMAGSKETEVSAKIKTKKITIDLRGGNTAIREPEKEKERDLLQGKEERKCIDYCFLQNEKWQDEKNEVQGQSNKNESTH